MSTDTGTTTSSTSAQPGKGGDDDSEGLFIISLGAALLGAFLLIVAGLMYITVSQADLGGTTPSLLEKRQWILAVGTGLFVLGVGLQANNIWELLYRRRSLFALNVILMSVLAIALTVLVDYVTHRHFHEFDWTRQGVFTISDESVQVAKSLDRDLRVWVIFREGGDAELVRRLVDHYRAKNARIEVVVLDPVLDSEKLLDAIRELGLEPKTIEDVEGVVIQSGTWEKSDTGVRTWKTERSKRLAKTDFFDSGFDPQSGQRGRKKFKGEQALTNSLIEVTQEKKSKIYFTQGHRELDPEGRNPGDYGQCGNLVKQLRSKNYEVAPLQIVERPQKDIPEDASAVVIAGPAQSFDQIEVAALDKYIREGGKVLALLDPAIKASNPDEVPEWRKIGLEELFKKYNVEVANSMVVGIKTLIYPDGTREEKHAAGGFANQFDTTSKITKPLVGSRIFLPRPRVIRATKTEDHADPHGAPKGDKRSAVEILKTSANFIALSDLGKRPEELGKEEKKSLPVAVAVEEKLEPKPGEKERVLRLVVVGDAVFASNYSLEQASNEPFLLNAFAWLLGQERFTKEPVKEGDYHLDIP
ncbi:MAG: Gldg family protein, partial [Planctomycetota bacterium]